MLQIQKLFGASLLVLGSALLAVSSAYFVYVKITDRTLEELRYDGERPNIERIDRSEVIGRGDSDEFSTPAVIEWKTSEGNISLDAGAIPRTRNVKPTEISQSSGQLSSEKITLAKTNESELMKVSGISKAVIQKAVQDKLQSDDTGSATTKVPLSGVASIKQIGMTKARPEKPTIEASEDNTENQKTPQADITGNAMKRGVVTGTENPANAGSRGRDFVETDTAPTAYTVSSTDQLAATPFLRYLGLNQRGSRHFAAKELPLEEEPAPAEKIVIPAIAVNSKVKELGLDLRSNPPRWKTPKWVVGHIPTTARPGEEGEGWYFGHLESPLLGEGNVFKKLPDIPKMLQSGETIEIILEGSQGKYIYLAYKSHWVEKDDLRISNSGNRDITLVTCYPRYRYDKRLLVTAALVEVIRS